MNTNSNKQVNIADILMGRVAPRNSTLDKFFTGEKAGYSFLHQKTLGGRNLKDIRRKQDQQALDFIAQRLRPNKSNYSPLQKAKYITRGGLNSATFGLTGLAAGLTNIPANYLAGNFKAPGKLFTEGRRDFRNEQQAFNEAHPRLGVISEVMGMLAPSGVGVGKLLKFGKRFTKVAQPVVQKKVYPHRTPEQWQRDYAYGKKLFNELRAKGPLIRPKSPNAKVNAISWGKIKQGNIPEKYAMLPDVPDIYRTGIYSGPRPNNKIRPDDFEWFHWYQKGNRGVQMAENKSGWMLYNVNPDVAEFLRTHPEAAKELGIKLL